MLGIKDPVIFIVYSLCIVSAIFCVIYGLKNWNTGLEHQPKPEDKNWAKKEDEISEQL